MFLARLIGSLCLMGLIQPLSTTVSAQKTDYSYINEVRQVGSPYSVTRAQLEQAQTLKDLYARYPADWVQSYESVSISVTRHQEPINSVGKDDRLTDEQKRLILGRNVGSDIFVRVVYVPKNDLKNNPTKEMTFVLTAKPTNNAYYYDGEKALLAYLKKQVVASIPDSLIRKDHAIAVQWTVNVNGDIRDVKMMESSTDTVVDSQIISAVEGMPRWHPAVYMNGSPTAQDFVFIVGDRASCVINTLNTL